MSGIKLGCLNCFKYITLNYLLFLFYFLLFCFFLTRIPFFKQSGIGSKTLIVLFSIKIAAGFGYAFFYQLPDYHANSDTYRFFNYSLAETDVLINNPFNFFKDIFSSGYSSTSNLFIAENSYWNDLKSNIIIKLLAICNVFSFKNYYINIIFFNFFFLFGIVGMYRIVQHLFVDKKWLLLGVLFFIPSCLFWCSGIHKDGLIVSAIGMLFWYFQQCLNKGFSLKKSLAIILLMLLLFSLRNYVCFALIIAFAAWFVAEKTKKTIATFSVIYVGGIILFFASSYMHTSINFPQYIVTKQQEFKQLSGGSLVETKNLAPTVQSFIVYFPQAIDITFFQPSIFQTKNKSYLPAIAENIGILFLLLGVIFYRKKTNKNSILLTTILFFGLTILIITGYTVSFSGAIVRYKSIYLPFLLMYILYWISIPNKVLRKLK